MENLLCLTLVIVMRIWLVEGDDLLTDASVKRRTLTRFKVGHEDNKMCWERHGLDGFVSPIDGHNHFRPFGGPPVDWHTYIGWMKDHGVVFSTMLGIGQLLKGDTPCCYYLHCPTYDYPVVPDPQNDYDNAQDYNELYKNQKLEKEMHLTLSMTFFNLQEPENNGRIMKELVKNFTGDFGWAGEVNVFKHALAANGFFKNGERVSEAYIKSGKLDSFFREMEDRKWPTTLHCDLGCDNYADVPAKFNCSVPEEELRLAKQNYRWWQNFLGPIHYKAFFDSSTNIPRKNFKKIQHLKIWNELLTRYSKMTVVWPHLGLSKELKFLHPTVHVYIIEKLMSKHPNLYADVSWDVLTKQLLMNYKEGRNASHLHPRNHADLHDSIDKSIVDTKELKELRNLLDETWDIHEDMFKNHGSVTGPSHAMSIYLEMFHKYPDRFITGTDFVNSLGEPDKFPGTLKKPRGCMKNKKNHAKQTIDTSSINMFLNDEAFKKIVLGENYFKILGLQDKFVAPEVCGDTVLSMQTIIGIGVGTALVVILIVLAVVFVVCCLRDKDDRASFIRVDGTGCSATTHV